MFLAGMGSHLPVGVVVDDGREDLPLVQLEVGRDEVEDDPVASVRLDAVLQLLVVQAEEGVSRGDPEQQLVPETGKEIINSSCAMLSMSAVVAQRRVLGFFLFSILSVVRPSLRSLEEVLHYLFFQ